MIDWALVAKLVGGGFGVTILIMSIMAVVIWILGVIFRRTSVGEKKHGDAD
ncbi:hypothetical protein ACFLTS_07505 [Chloroflexota bacterium]